MSEKKRVDDVRNALKDIISVFDNMTRADALKKIKKNSDNMFWMPPRFRKNRKFSE